MSFKVYILESLREDDLKTGQMIKSSLDSENISNKYFHIDSSEAFDESIEAIIKDISKHKLLPVIHFDCHADDEGIAIIPSDGDEIALDWEEFRKDLRNIYSSSGRKSILSMSCCEGFYISRMVAHNEPCPFDHACGSFLEIGFQDSHDIFFELYKLMKTGEPVYQASVEVSNRSDFSHMQFVGLNSYNLFKIAIDGYLKLQFTPKKIAERRTNLESDFIAKYGSIDALNKHNLDYLLSEVGQRKILEERAKIFFS